MTEQTEQEPIDPWGAATARIRGLANHGAWVCPQFTYRDEVPISCERCGYEADVHLVRDLRERGEQIARFELERQLAATRAETLRRLRRHLHRASGAWAEQRADPRAVEYCEARKQAVCQSGSGPPREDWRHDTHVP